MGKRKSTKQVPTVQTAFFDDVIETGNKKTKADATSESVVFRLQIRDVKQFLALLDIFDDMSHNMNLYIEDNNIYVNAMCGSNVTLVVARLKQDFFSSFYSRRKTAIGIHFPTLIGSIKNCKEGAILTYTETEMDGAIINKLKISYNLERTSGKVKTAINTLYIDTEILTPPPRKVELELSITPSDLLESLNTISGSGTDVTFLAYGATITLVSRGDNKTTKVKLDGLDGIIITTSEQYTKENPFSITFSLEIITKLVKNFLKSDNMSINFDANCIFLKSETDELLLSFYSARKNGQD